VTAYDGTGSRQGRRELQRRRRKQVRRRLGVAGLAVLVVLALVATALLVRRKDVPTSSVVKQMRTQHTLLLQVRGADGNAVVTALLAHDAAGGSGAVVLLPPQVIVTLPGAGPLPLGRALSVAPQLSTRNAVADLLGVTVDGSWLLDLPTLQRLVDAEGGVQVTVDQPVLSGRTVVLQPGAQRLDGARAVSFATYAAPMEAEEGRLARLQAVLDGLLTALPAQPATLLGRLGPGSQHSLPPAELAAMLSGLAADDKASELQYETLPVIKIDAGTDETRLRVDAAATRTLVDRLLSQSVPPGARQTGNRVLVLNGVGTPGVGEKVRAKLVPAGFVYVSSRNAEHFGYPRSEVLVRDATPAGAALGDRVAKALGLPVRDVQTHDIGEIADVVVLVGGDFRP